MKKTLLIAMVVMFGMTAKAQTSLHVPINPAVKQKTMKTGPVKIFDLGQQKTQSSTKPQSFLQKSQKASPAQVLATETKIGETTYDLQTNSAVANRIVYNNNGTVQATWTFSTELNAIWNDRGAGYNYYDGTSWGAMPTARIEGNTRTGWPEILTLANGNEVVISHAPAEMVLMKSVRTVAGSGSWSVTPLTSLAPLSVLWPRMAVGGPDGNTIHLIAHNDQEAAPYKGVKGMFFYSRSLDGGVTWDIQNVQLPGFDSTNYTYLSADGYAISANGDDVAIVYFGALTKTILAKSDDNGQTWTAKTVVDIPILYDPASTNTSGSPLGISDFNGDGIADTLKNSSDNSGTVIVDDNGVAHVFFGFMNYMDDTPSDNSWSFFPVTDGIGYWNEGMGNIEPQMIAGILDVDQSGILLDNLTDPNTEFGLYYSSLSTMPSAGIDSNGCMYLAYTGIVETLTSGSQYYRHVYMTRSCDNGCTWTYPVDVTPNDDFAECVFPSLAHNVGAQFHLVYQKDPEPGLNLQGDEDAVALNEIMYVKGDVSSLDSNTWACVAGIMAQTTVFCSGDSMLVTATCGSSWLWSNGATTQSTYVKTFGNLSCDITTECGVRSDTLNFIAPSTAPTVVVEASDEEACPGDSIMLTTNNVSSATWLWSTGDSTQSITAVTTGADTYTVTVTNCGGTATKSITIGLPPAPEAVIDGETTICPNDSIALFATEGSGMSYTWSTGDSTDFIVVNDTGTYKVTVTNCSGSDSAMVFINYTPAPIANITVPGNDTVLCQGQNVGLIASGAGIGGTYLWSSGETTNTITVTTAGTYKVTTFNSCGDSAVSSSVTVVVNPLPPTPAITCYSDGSQWGFVCPQCASGTTQWYLNGSVMSSQTNDTLLVEWTMVNNGAITVKTTDANGCSSTSPNGNCFVGMEEITAGSTFSVYPNPNNGIFTLVFSNNENEKQDITVKNVIGQVIYSKKAVISGNQMNVNLSDFKAGIYFLTVSGHTQKIIIR